MAKGQLKRRRVKKYSKPAKYRGIALRSQTELKWLIRLNKWKMEWEYESVSMPSVYYLPDFYLPKIKTILEVKGIWSKDDIRTMGYAWSWLIRHRYTIAVGQYDWSHSRKVLYWGVIRPTPGDIYKGRSAVERTSKVSIDYNNSAVFECPACSVKFFESTEGTAFCPSCKKKVTNIFEQNKYRYPKRPLFEGNYREMMNWSKEWRTQKSSGK